MCPLVINYMYAYIGILACRGVRGGEYVYIMKNGRIRSSLFQSSVQKLLHLVCVCGGGGGGEGGGGRSEGVGGDISLFPLLVV